LLATTADDEVAGAGVDELDDEVPELVLAVPGVPELFEAQPEITTAAAPRRPARPARRVDRGDEVRILTPLR
jgi:hypothetical protein